jgi:hypothetical protein
MDGAERAGEGVAHTVLVPTSFDDLLANSDETFALFLGAGSRFDLDQPGAFADGPETAAKIGDGIVECSRALRRGRQGQSEPFLERGNDFDVLLLPVLGGPAAHVDAVGNVGGVEFHGLAFGPQAGEQANGDVADQLRIVIECRAEQAYTLVVVQDGRGRVIHASPVNELDVGDRIFLGEFHGLDTPVEENSKTVAIGIEGFVLVRRWK